MLKARKSKAHIGNAKIRGIRGNYQLEHLKKDLFKELMSQRRPSNCYATLMFRGTPCILPIIPSAWFGIAAISQIVLSRQ